MTNKITVTFEIPARKKFTKLACTSFAKQGFSYLFHNYNRSTTHQGSFFYIYKAQIIVLAFNLRLVFLLFILSLFTTDRLFFF